MEFKPAVRMVIGFATVRPIPVENEPDKDGRPRDDVEPRLRTTGAPRHRSICTASWGWFANITLTASNGGRGSRPTAACDRK